MRNAISENFITLGGRLAALVVLLFAAGCASTPWFGDAHGHNEEPQPASDQAADERNVATQQGIREARAAIAQAQAEGGDVNEAEGLLAQAIAAAEAGDNLSAQRLARQAEVSAQGAVNAKFLAEAKRELTVTKTYTNVNAEQYERLRAAENAIVNNRGKSALELLQALNAQMAAANSSYTVRGGDTLWKIAGYDEIYGNPYQWPLIYKANYKIIKNPDVIFVNQKLSIISHPTLRQVELAVEHANARHHSRSKRSADRAYLKKALAED